LAARRAAKQQNNTPINFWPKQLRFRFVYYRPGITFCLFYGYNMDREEPYSENNMTSAFSASRRAAVIGAGNVGATFSYSLLLIGPANKMF
jgi:hypothetical protein